MSELSTVLSVGFGKAGHTLHGPNWLNEGRDITAFDADPAKLEVTNLPDRMQTAHAAGRLSTLSTLEELSLENLGIIDVVTASGQHTSSVEQTLQVLEGRGVSGAQLTWLLEKPVVSSGSEAEQLIRLFKDGRLDGEKVFVNENYNASAGVELARAMIGDTPVSEVDVVFYKDRVPDVRKGRFTDPVLGAYGIEMPHMVAVGYNLAGFQPNDNTRIIQNQHLKNIHNVPESTGNYTVVEGENGVKLRMAQGLGPYEMDGSGTIVANENPGIVRYSTVRLADGRQITVEFDPVAGIDRYTSRVSEYDTKGDVTRSEIVSDNTLAAVIHGVSEVERTHNQSRPPFAEAINVPNALAYVEAIRSYVSHADRS
jgi:hypothetical protein